MYAFRALNPLARKQVTHQRRRGHGPIFGGAALSKGNRALLCIVRLWLYCCRRSLGRQTIVIAIDKQAKPPEQTQKAGACLHLPKWLDRRTCMRWLSPWRCSLPRQKMARARVRMLSNTFLTITRGKPNATLRSLALYAACD